MEAIFWVACSACRRKFYCDSSLRHAGVPLICPYCKEMFMPADAPWIDERSRG